MNIWDTILGYKTYSITLNNLEIGSFKAYKNATDSELQTLAFPIITEYMIKNSFDKNVLWDIKSDKKGVYAHSIDSEFLHQDTIPDKYHRIRHEVKLKIDPKLIEEDDDARTITADDVDSYLEYHKQYVAQSKLKKQKQ